MILGGVRLEKFIKGQSKRCKQCLRACVCVCDSDGVRGMFVPETKRSHF